MIFLAVKGTWSPQTIYISCKTALHGLICGRTNLSLPQESQGQSVAAAVLLEELHWTSPPPQVLQR